MPDASPLTFMVQRTSEGNFAETCPADGCRLEQPSGAAARWVISFATLTELLALVSKLYRGDPVLIKRTDDLGRHPTLPEWTIEIVDDWL